MCGEVTMLGDRAHQRPAEWEWSVAGSKVRKPSLWSQFAECLCDETIHEWPDCGLGGCWWPGMSWPRLDRKLVTLERGSRLSSGQGVEGSLG